MNKNTLFLYLGIFPIIFIFFRGFIPSSLSWLDDAIFLFYIIVSSLVISLANNGRVHKPPIFFMIFVLACLMAWMVNLNPSWLLPQFLGFIVLFKTFIVLFIGVNLPISWDYRFKLYKIFVLLSVITSCVVIAQLIFPTIDSLPFLYNASKLSHESNLVFRKSAYFRSTNELGYTLAIASLLSLYGWVITKRKKYILFLLINFIGVYGTYSRAAMLILFLIITLFMLRVYRGFILKIGIISLVSTLFILIVALSGQWHERINNYESRNIQSLYRVQSSLIALRIVHDHPLFGTGPGSYGSAISKKYKSNIEKKYGLAYIRDKMFGKYPPMTTDVFWAHFLAEYGLIPFVFMFIFFVSIIWYPRHGIGIYYKHINIERSVISLMLLTLVITSFSSFSIETLSVSIIVFLFSGIYWSNAKKHLIKANYFSLLIKTL